MKSHKDIKRTIENVFDNRFCNRKNETSPLLLKRKSKITAKLYEKYHKVIKRNIENTFDVCFCNRKIETSPLMLERKIENICKVV